MLVWTKEIASMPNRFLETRRERVLVFDRALGTHHPEAKYFIA